MGSRVTGAFNITGWEETSKEEPAAGITLSQATIKKTFHGEIEGTSIATGLLCGGANEGGGYIAQERFDGRVGDKSGTFVFQHGGLRWSGGQKSFGNVVPGTGTGELSGLRGEAVLAHDETGATLTLDYEFE